MGLRAFSCFGGTSGDEVEIELDARISRMAFDVSITAIQIFGFLKRFVKAVVETLM